MNRIPSLTAYEPISRRKFLLASGAVVGYLAARPSQVFAIPGVSQSLAEMRRDFATPPDTSKPWVYYWWLDGVATPEGITADLEEMKKKGINGVLIFDAGTAGPAAAKGPRFMTEEWRVNFRHAVKEAGRLKMEMGVNLCTGWDAGGPWVEREDAIKILVWREVEVKGPTALWEEDLKKTAPLKTVVGDVPTVAPENWHRYITSLASKKTRGNVWQSSVTETLHSEQQGGRTKWNVPEGDWTVLQFGYMLSGAMTKLPSGELRGWEIDPMSAKALDHHFDNTARKMIEDAGSLAGSTLKYTHIDSWEIGQPSWTGAFVEEFKSRRGYDPLPFLPAIAGKTVDTAEISERFLWDYRKTIADLVQANYYGRLSELSHRFGLGTHSEAGGPFFFQYIDAMSCLGEDDIPMAEFWSTRNHDVDRQAVSDLFFNSSSLQVPESYFGCIRQAASTARVYNRKLCQAESFTGFDRDWTEDPYYLKADGDRAFCQGLQRMVIHHYALVPDFGVKPGNQWEHISIHFNRNITWWDKSGAWLSYIGRCQHMLQQGTFVADLLFYAGEAVPNFVLADRKPVAGYDFDCVNAEALLKKATVQDKLIEFDSGTRYRYLIIPGVAGVSMSVEVLTKLRDMVRSGMTLIATPPTRTPGLSSYPTADADLHRLVVELWGDGSLPPAGERIFGQGRVIWGKAVDAVLAMDGVKPDVEILGPIAPHQIDWIHRRTEAADIYFIANDSEEALQRDVTFQITGRTPLLFDAEHGTSQIIHEARERGGRTLVQMKFAAKQSFFVVFPATSESMKPLAKTLSAAFPSMQTYATLDGPWQVAFDPAWGAPAQVTFESLQDWTTHSDDGIRHYSGQATYAKTFVHQGPIVGRSYLDLGAVKNVAEVYLNGKPLGIVWTAPWRVEITDAVKTGENELKIEVVNLWPNRLIKDATLPKEKRLTSTNVRTYDPVIPKDLDIWGNPIELERLKNGTPPALFPAGLLGPVTLLREVKPVER
jgi:alpha-L-rhamnosidase